MSKLRAQHGFTLMELMVAMTLFLVVMMATFAALDGFRENTTRNERQNLAQDTARTTIDRMAAELRNARTIEKAGATDVVFTKVNPSPPSAGSLNAENVMRVRYCLTGTTLVRQTRTWATLADPGLPATVTCPEVAVWTPSETVATGVRNTTSACAPTASTAPCPVFSYDSATLTSIKSAGLVVIIDADTSARPVATRLDTTVAIRNQVDGS